MPAVPSQPTAITVGGGKLTASNFNAIVSYLAFQTAPPRFYGLIVSTNTLAVTAGQPIKVPSIKDTAAGWNATNGQYTVQYPGTYKVQCALTWGSSGAPASAQAIYIRLNATQVINSPATANTANFGPILSWDVTCAASDIIDFVALLACTAVAGTCLSITWTGS